MGFMQQNNLFCSCEVSDVSKKFITSLNVLIINDLNTKVTKLMKIVISFFFQ